MSSFLSRKLRRGSLGGGALRVVSNASHSPGGERANEDEIDVGESVPISHQESAFKSSSILGELMQPNVDQNRAGERHIEEDHLFRKRCVATTNEGNNRRQSYLDQMLAKRESNAGTGGDSLDRRTSTESAGSNRHSGDSVDLQCVQRPWAVTDFVLGKPLGKGKFGNVYAAKQRRGNASVALKVLFKAQLQTANCVHLLRREVELQHRLKHPNIVELYGYFQDAKNVYLLLEFMGQGELFRYIRKNGGGRMTETVCRNYMRDIASALQFMHNRHVWHRDIKLENCLVTDDGRLKIADFGWAAHAPPPHSTRYTMCGTPEYLAPEMIAETGHTSAVDNWAMGVLCFEVLYGRTPFYEKQRKPEDEDNTSSDVQFEAQQRTFERICAHTGKLDFPTIEASMNFSQTITVEAKNVIDSLLQPQPENRMTASQLLESAWMINI